MRSRPVVFCTAAAAIVLYFAIRLDIWVNPRILLALIGLSLLGTVFLKSKPHLHTVLVTVCAACAALVLLEGYDHFIVTPIRSCAGKVLEVTAVLCDDPAVYETNQRAKLKINPAGPVERPFYAYCYLPLTDEPLLAGDHVRLKAKFYMAGTSEGFDRAIYQAGNGCFITAAYAKNKDGEILSFSYEQGDRKSLQTLPDRIVRTYKKQIDELFPQKESGLMRALLLGDKTGLERMDYASLRKAGLSHLVAVSGLHVGFLVSFCYLLFGRRIGTAVSIPVILCFMPVAGMSPSVIRAGIMYLVTAGGFFLKKEADSLNSLFIALLFLLVNNPYSIMSLSLQLSFAATLGLILFANPMQKQLLRLLNKKLPRLIKKFFTILAGAVSCSVCALAFTTPVLLSSFGYVSILSLISNIAVVGVTAVCFLGGLLSCLLYVLSHSAAQVIATMVCPLLQYIQHVADTVSRLPFGLVHWGNGLGLAALVLFFVTVFVWIYRTKLHHPRIWLGILCSTVVLFSAAGMIYEQMHYTVTILPCGEGEAVIASEPNGKMVLIDCSGSGSYKSASDEVEEWMLWHGFDRIDTLILTAVDQGHARDLPVLMDTVEIASIYIPSGVKETKTNAELLSLLNHADIPVQEISEQMSCATMPPVTSFPVTDGKLGVAIGEEIVILHSPTQKQLAAYLQNNICSAPVAILSGRHIEDVELLRNALSVLGTRQVILQTGRDSIEKFNGIPFISTYETGEQTYQYPKE